MFTNNLIQPDQSADATTCIFSLFLLLFVHSLVKCPSPTLWSSSFPSVVDNGVINDGIGANTAAVTTESCAGEENKEP